MLTSDSDCTLRGITSLASFLNYQRNRIVWAANPQRLAVRVFKAIAIAAIFS